MEALDSGAQAETIAEQAGLPLDIVFQFERIGRKQLVPELIVADFPAQRAMSKLPFSEQERLLGRDTISVCVIKETGVETLQIPARNLSKAHVKQVFDEGRLRTVGEQRSWLEARAAANAEPPRTNADPYVVRRDELIVGGVTFTKKQLLRIVADMP